MKALCAALSLVAAGSIAAPHGKSHTPAAPQQLAPVPAASRPVDAEEERQLRYQAGHRWFARTDEDGDGDVYALHNFDRPADCHGELRAVLGRLSDGRFAVLKELCWAKSNDGSAVTITDPHALLFKSKQMPTSEFRYVKSQRELKAEEAAQNAQAQAEWLQQAFPQQPQQPRAPVTVFCQGGDSLIICDGF